VTGSIIMAWLHSWERVMHMGHTLLRWPPLAKSCISTRWDSMVGTLGNKKVKL